MKNGFTTGTCAQAASKAACMMLSRQEMLKEVDVQTPSGVRLRLKLTDQQIGRNFARCAVIKRSAEAPDVTNGAKIFARVSLSRAKGIIIKGAQGIGRVTKPGLAIGLGEWAINPVPRRMILKEASKFLPANKGLEISISAPAGRELAKKTYNPKLGIVGGISIIGTTGIVMPRSLKAYRASLALELDVLKAQGYKKAVFVLGYVGEKYSREALKLKNDAIIKIGDHVGFMLRECARRGIREALLIGHIGKLIKVAGGQFNTHCRFGDNRVKAIARYAKLCSASKKAIKDILGQATAEATIEILAKDGSLKVFEEIARDVSIKARQFADNKVNINCIVLSLKGKVLGKA